jgi:hypothetical protein
MRFLALLVLGIILHASTVHAEPAVAGFIKTLEGSGHVLRDSSAVPAKIGDPLLVSDTVTTSDQSSLGIMLEDDTILSLGPNSRLELNDFAFAPQKELFSIAIRLLKGSFAYMSGAIARLAPERIRIETPDAVIAVHGTRFLVKVEE